MNSLKNRIQKGIKPGFWNATTLLKDFAIVTYLVEVEKLKKHIPIEFEIVTIEVNGKKMGIMSAVPFLDKDFHIKKFFPFIKFQFYQTNYRVYVKEKSTGEHIAWFFGTNLGSVIVNIPRVLWRIPWHYAKYKDTGKNENYKLNIASKFNSGDIEFTKTNQQIELIEGFESMTEMMLILTHPIKGAYYKLNGEIGTYKIAHPKMELKLGQAKQLYFSLYEKLELLTKDEMNKPFAIFYLNDIRFDIELPPKNNA